MLAATATAACTAVRAHVFPPAPPQVPAGRAEAACSPEPVLARRQGGAEPELGGPQNLPRHRLQGTWRWQRQGCAVCDAGALADAAAWEGRPPVAACASACPACHLSACAQAWSGCRGSIPDRRGYTCGLWQLFHTLASRLPDTDNSGAVWLAAVKGFVSNFFQVGPGCTVAGAVLGQRWSSQERRCGTGAPWRPPSRSCPGLHPTAAVHRVRQALYAARKRGGGGGGGAQA